MTPGDPLTDGRILRLVEDALMEDIGLGDVTTDAVVAEGSTSRGEIRVKEQGVIAGLEVARIVFQAVDEALTYSTKSRDGILMEAGSLVARVEGSTSSILKAERTVLNILQRMSGVATLTRKFVDAVEGTGARITDTRKTVPGLRILDKLAVKIGGGVNHRFGLDDMVLIKDNHIDAAGGISTAIGRCLEYLKRKHYSLKVEVETRNLAEVGEALRRGGVDRIMLDNFTAGEMRQAVALVKGRLEVEASGNVTLGNVREIAETGVNFISVGALTHSAKALDISLKVSH